MRILLSFEIIIFCLTSCSSHTEVKENNPPEINKNFYKDWDLIALDWRSSRYIIEARNDSLTISHFIYVTLQGVEGQSLGTRDLDTIRYGSINKNLKEILATNAINILQHAHPKAIDYCPNECYNSDTITKLQIMLTKDDSIQCSCIYVSASTKIQPDVEKILNVITQLK